jgi:hypothetical protein
MRYKRQKSNFEDFPQKKQLLEIHIHILVVSLLRADAKGCRIEAN